MESFRGTWIQTSAEKYEEFLKALEVNWLLRKAAQASNQELIITEEEGVWAIQTSTVLKTIRKEFKLNEEFDERTPDMRDVRTLVTFESGKILLVEKPKNKNHKGARGVYELNGSDEIIYKMWVEGIEDLVGVLTFKRVM